MTETETALEMYDFIKACKDKHLTLENVKNMQVGDKIDVVIWDRNFEEYWIWDNAVDGKLYDPQEFFKYNRHQIVYKGDMRWDIHFNHGDVFEHEIHLDVSSLETTWLWVPIHEIDGKIHITSECIKENETIPEHWRPKHIHWSKFPDQTRVGWRGAIMLWDHLSSLPQVYYNAFRDDEKEPEIEKKERICKNCSQQVAENYIMRRCIACKTEFCNNCGGDNFDEHSENCEARKEYEKNRVPDICFYCQKEIEGACYRLDCPYCRYDIFQCWDCDKANVSTDNYKNHVLNCSAEYEKANDQ